MFIAPAFGLTAAELPMAFKKVEHLSEVFPIDNTSVLIRLHPFDPHHLRHKSSEFISDNHFKID